MKKWKVWMSRLLVCIMTLMCLSGSYPAVNVHAAGAGISAGADGVINYVALGDSITSPSDSYVKTVSDYLKKTYGSCVTSNLAVDAWKSGDLLDAITNLANSKYSSYRAQIKKADVITLDIGSNDILVTAREAAAEVIGCPYEEFDITVIKMLIELQNATGFSAILKYIQAYALASSVRTELTSGSTMKNAVVAYEKNYVAILAEIKKLAPNAKVYIGNIFNPYVEAAPMCLGSYEIVDLETMSQQYIEQINTIIKNNANGSVVVDLYNTINDPKYIRGDVRNYNYDPHPNATGQTAIANKFIAAMK